jgi:putative hydrolase of the HAD superfamily
MKEPGFSEKPGFFLDEGGNVESTLIFDADDTLWETEVHYSQCIADFAALMAEQGFDREEARETMAAVERERVPEVGYAPEEFIRSLVIAYERLCASYEKPVDEDVTDAVWAIGRTVMTYPIVLLDGVEETLDALSRHYRLLLLTKGDQETQKGKLARSGLEDLFDAVHVVPEKDADVFQAIISRYNLPLDRTWMVGNSPRSDINPALEVGIGAFYVPNPGTWTLEIEELKDPEKVTVLDRFGELTTLLVESER